MEVVVSALSSLVEVFIGDVRYGRMGGCVDVLCSVFDDGGSDEDVVVVGLTTSRFLCRLATKRPLADRTDFADELTIIRERAVTEAHFLWRLSHTSQYRKTLSERYCKLDEISLLVRGPCVAIFWVALESLYDIVIVSWMEWSGSLRRKTICISA